MNSLNLFAFTPVACYATFKAIEATVMTNSTTCSGSQQYYMMALLVIFAILSFVLCFVDWKVKPTTSSRFRFNSKILGAAILSLISFCALTLPMYPLASCLYSPALPVYVPFAIVFFVHYLEAQVAFFLEIPPDPISSSVDAETTEYEAPSRATKP
ncbi:hypothetical protein HDV03_001646 [Kappamyces sp. JEL0829]|nr:hypothetical protein HDV03_001646 [Kappamyces sp. JEL0829]